MTKAVWIIFILFALGNAFFALPFHVGSQKITTSNTENYKKDSVLIRTVFPDSPICLKLNLESKYLAILQKTDSMICASSNPIPLLVNINVKHDVDFLSVIFPFYKSDNFNAEISYRSILKIEDQPDRDSLALNSQVAVKGNITLLGIFTPMYARKLVENELAMIVKKEMEKVKWDVNKPEAIDTSYLIPEPVEPVKPVKKAKKRRK
jgi:hypothetical protein